MRPIDADPLIEELNSLQVIVTGVRTGKGALCQIINEYQKSVLKIVNEQPTVDIAPRNDHAGCEDLKATKSKSKKDLMRVIRTVGISGKTYEEYIEALADRLVLDNVY